MWNGFIWFLYYLRGFLGGMFQHAKVGKAPGQRPREVFGGSGLEWFYMVSKLI